MKWILPLGLMLLVSCQMAPTKLTQQEAAMATGRKSVQNLLEENPVILDARSAFEFNLNHVPGSINVRWEDFSQQNPHSRGMLEPDLFSLARRLALVGVTPERPVLVLGRGRAGGGEEGRVAWTLKVLGVREVLTAEMSVLRSLPPRNEPLVENKPYWKPVVDESLWTDMRSFKDLVRNQQIPRSLPRREKGATAKAGSGTDRLIMGLPAQELLPRMVVLDVRSPEEFYIENLTQKKNVSVPVTQILWTEFFDAAGFPQKSVLSALEEKGVTAMSYVFVISRHGVRSGAVTYALRQLGWKHVTNVAGGYEQWNVMR